MAGDRPNGPVKFKPVKTSVTEDTENHLEKANDVKLQFRAVNPAGGSESNHRSASVQDKDTIPQFKAVASREDAPEQPGIRGNDSKPLFRPVNPGSTSSISGTTQYPTRYSDSQNQDEEWKEELTSFLTIVRGLAYIKSSELTEALGGGKLAPRGQDSKPSQSAAGTNISPKNGCVTVLLCLFLGFLGAHRFYTGHIGMGFLYLFTGGLFVFGWIIDLFNLLSGFFRDSKKRLIKW
ncbi:MAG: TM2 domain-containing protein [Candidatus Cloacimonas sp.]